MYAVMSLFGVEATDARTYGVVLLVAVREP